MTPTLLRTSSRIYTPNPLPSTPSIPKPTLPSPLPCPKSKTNEMLRRTPLVRSCMLRQKRRGTRSAMPPHHAQTPKLQVKQTPMAPSITPSNVLAKPRDDDGLGSECAFLSRAVLSCSLVFESSKVRPTHLDSSNRLWFGLLRSHRSRWACATP